MKHILFLTTANLATNPRLVKEIDVLSIKHKVSVVLFNIGGWSVQLNQKMKAQRAHIHFIELDVTRTSFLHFIYWAILEKVARIIYPFFKGNLNVVALANSRRSWMLLNAIKNLKCDVIIGHTLGTLYPIHKYQRKHKVTSIYDIEDYDPGIVAQNTGTHYVTISEQLSKTILPSIDKLSSASPLIGEYTLKLIGGHANHQVILNSFPKIEFSNTIPNSSTSSALRMVWFSQNISYGRGIEQLLEAIDTLSKDLLMDLHITLIGNLDNNFHKEILKPFIEKGHCQLELKAPLLQADLHQSLINYDVGLAIELSNADFNRQLCLTNKIIAYAQSGLYILATDTLAQEQFINEHPQLGIVTKQDVDNIAETIAKLIADKNNMRYNRENRYLIGKELSWEREQEKIQL